MNPDILKVMIDAHLRLWNSLIPARAITIEHNGTTVRYLHPTKGWRSVSNKRLGLA